jgi:hypothetical protein
MIASAPGASTSIGTVLPFSAISGAIRVMPVPAIGTAGEGIDGLFQTLGRGDLGKPEKGGGGDQTGPDKLPACYVHGSLLVLRRRSRSQYSVSVSR